MYKRAILLRICGSLSDLETSLFALINESPFKINESRLACKLKVIESLSSNDPAFFGGFSKKNSSFTYGDFSKFRIEELWAT